MQIAVELPNDFMALREKQTVEQEMRLSYALQLFKDSRITLSKAAQLAGLNHYDFMGACKKEAIPVINISKQELLEELENI
jgi:predicted HTH domain antitoxin